MDPVLEVKPSACLLLLGPQLTRLESGRLSYKSLLEAGLTFLQQHGLGERDNGSTFAKEVDLDKLKKQGYVSAMQKVVQVLKEKDLYEEWLEKTLGGSKLQSFDFPDSLQWVLELQQMGAMLACTQYDTLLDDLAGQTPAVVSSNNPAFLKWLKAGETSYLKHELQQQQQSRLQGRSISAELNGSEKCGILHLHGVHTLLESVSLLPYSQAEHTKHLSSEEGNGERVNEGAGGCVTNLGTRLSEIHLASLREIFLNKLVLMVGFNSDCDDPLLPSLLKVIYPDKDLRNLKNPPILLTSSPSCYSLPSFSSPDLFLRLILPSPENLREIIVPGSSRNFAVGRDHIEATGRAPSEGLKVQAFLLFNEKQSFRKLGDFIYNQSKSGEIYVRRDALTVIFDHTKILYGNLVTYGGSGLRQLWDLIFAKDSTLVGKGLLGLGLHNSVIVWLNRKPKGLRNITGINSVHTNAAHIAIRSMAMSRNSSSSSGESFSDSKSPLFSPVTSATSGPAHQPQAPSHSNSSPPKQAMHGNKVPLSISPTVSSKMAGTTSSVSSVPPPLLALIPHAPFPIPTVLPKSVTQGLPLLGSPSLMPGRVQFPVPVPIGTPIPSQQSSPVTQAVLPSMLPPLSVPRSLVPQQPTPSGLSSLVISGPFNQMDLEVLKDLQKKITDRLLATQQVMVPSEEGTSEQGKATMPPRLLEWKTAVDSVPAAMVEFIHCVAGSAEKLEQIPSHQERLRRLLTQHEVKIQYIDTRPPLQAPPHQQHLADPNSQQAPLGTRTAHQVSLTREPLLLQNLRPTSSLTASSTSPTSSSTTSPLIASAPTPCIAATPTTSTVASCPFTLPTSVTPAVPNPALLSLPSPYGPGIVGPLTLGQTTVSGGITAGATPGQVQSPVIFLPQQAMGFAPSPQPPGGSYCLIPAPFQHPPQLSIANIASPLAVSSTFSSIASSAVASLPQQATSLIPGLSMPPAGTVLVNNMALTAGGVNTPMYFVMPAYPTILPAAAQALPQPAAPSLQVARSASVMLDQQRAIQQLIRNQEVAAAAATGNGRQRTSLESTGRVSKRTRPLDLPDSMGEKIMKIENPAAAGSSSSPSKFSSMAAKQNHPRWSFNKSGGSGACVVDVGKAAAHGLRTVSSSESEESGKLGEE